MPGVRKRADERLRTQMRGRKVCPLAHTTDDLDREARAQAACCRAILS
jgi:hypothetical protein